MEKFVKFEDPTCGINPFLPLEIKEENKLSPLWQYLRYLMKIFLIISRVPCVILNVFLLFCLNTQKYILLQQDLIWLFERFIDSVLYKMLLSITSFNLNKETYHREDKGFDFVKWQKNQLQVTKIDGDVIIANQTCFVDWFFLKMQYSPIFTKIVIIKSDSGHQAGLRVLTLFEIFKNSLGIVLPEEREKGKHDDVYFSIKDIREKHGMLFKIHKNTPIVIFPEGTKTNGQGILDIEKDILRIIEKAASPEENQRIIAIRFDHSFKYFSAYNTTDQTGIKQFISTVSQFSSKHHVQYFFNIHENINKCKNFEEKSEFIKRSLMTKSKEKSLKSLNWKSHKEFLQLWEKTSQFNKFN